ncbi:MAG: hypothetical protein ACXVAR_01135 [Vulcanimicrobiaceae bacterium]
MIHASSFLEGRTVAGRLLCMALLAILASCSASTASDVSILTASPKLASDMEAYSENCDSNEEPRVQRALDATRRALMRDLTAPQASQIVGAAALQDPRLARERAAIALTALMNCSTH